MCQINNAFFIFGEKENSQLPRDFVYFRDSLYERPRTITGARCVVKKHIYTKIPDAMPFKARIFIKKNKWLRISEQPWQLHGGKSASSLDSTKSPFVSQTNTDE